jgi:hypothetical protein
MAVIVALMSMLLMAALGAALVLTTSAETIVAANFREAQQGVYAAEAAFDLATADLALAPDWTAVLDGSAPSSFASEPPGPLRTLADGTPLDLDRLANMLNCRKARGCTAANLVAVTAQRPWGANNPVWELYLYAPLSAVLADASVASSQYVVVLVADDASENDGDPRRDGDQGTNPGAGRLVVRAEAFGSRGAHQVIEATVARRLPAGLRVVSWRLLR